MPGVQENKESISGQKAAILSFKVKKMQIYTCVSVASEWTTGTSSVLLLFLMPAWQLGNLTTCFWMG